MFIWPPTISENVAKWFENVSIEMELETKMPQMKNKKNFQENAIRKREKSAKQDTHDWLSKKWNRKRTMSATTNWHTTLHSDKRNNETEKLRLLKSIHIWDQQTKRASGREKSWKKGKEDGGIHGIRQSEKSPSSCVAYYSKPLSERKIPFRCLSFFFLFSVVICLFRLFEWHNIRNAYNDVG